MRGRFLAATAIAAAVGLVGAAPAQAVLVQLSTGHVDLLDVDWSGGALTLDLHDYVAGIDRNPADVELIVKTAAETTVPINPAYDFLGPDHDPVWVLPQGQPEATSMNVLWLGWNSKGATGNPPGSMTIRLKTVSGPADFSVFTVGMFGAVTVLLDSGNGLPDTRALPVNAHEHANWAFEDCGTYDVTFEVTAAGGVTTGDKTYRFIVEC